MNSLLFVTTTTKTIHNCILKGSDVTNHSAGLNRGSGRILITVQSQESLVQSYKGRTIRKVMGGMGKKPKKNSCKGKCQEKKFVQRRRERKKIHAEGRSNCDFYLIYKICQQAC